MTVCIACGASFHRPPSKVGAGYCSWACHRDAHNDLARFRPGAPTDAHQRFCDCWRAERVAYELERAGGLGS